MLPAPTMKGALGILAATFLGFYFATNNWVWGLVAALAWLFLPWLEILTRIRALRLPKEKQLRPKSPPSSDTFPALSEITREIEDERVRLASGSTDAAVLPEHREGT